MISTAVVSILLLVFLSENCAGMNPMNAVQVHINDTKRSPLIKTPFAKQLQQSLRKQLFSKPPIALGELFKNPLFEQEMLRITQTLAVKKAQSNVQFQPPMDHVFDAFRGTEELGDIRVVILGQDPTPKSGQATGLAFSIPPNSNPTRVSTGNILELLDNHGYRVNLGKGDLTKWANQGVLLLNSALTITAGNKSESGWHQKLWKNFTKELITKISTDAKHPQVWMLWGRKAQKYKPYIDKTRHLVLESVHPSPRNGDQFENQPDIFGKANQFLAQSGQKPIDWNLV